MASQFSLPKLELFRKIEFSSTIHTHMCVSQQSGMEFLQMKRSYKTSKLIISVLAVVVYGHCCSVSV